MLILSLIHFNQITEQKEDALYELMYSKMINVKSHLQHIIRRKAISNKKAYGHSYSGRSPFIIVCTKAGLDSSSNCVSEDGSRDDRNTI